MSDHVVTASQRLFGTLPDGRQVTAVMLSDGRGIAATVISYGATLQALTLPDRSGDVADVTLGHATIEEYLATPQYLGSTVGRYANRIAGGRFTLDGVAYQLPINNGPNSLHGGAEGFDARLWDITAIESGPVASVALRLVSPDGDQGYPGTLTVDARYALDTAGRLAISYRATTDRPTIVNLTNHAYWNLAGEGSATGAMEHVLTIPAEHYLPTDACSIPTGERRPVAGTPFDFRVPRVIGAEVREAADAQIAIGRGYDHSWIIGDPASEPRLVARLHDPRSGRTLDLLSDQPGLQFYSGNFLDAMTRGKAGRLYRQGDGVALEPQRFPDAPNQPVLGPVRLDPGETYRHDIVYCFSTGG